MKRYDLSRIMTRAHYIFGRSYYSSRMGRNDWRCDYRNDAKATVIRSFNAR